MRLQSFIPSFLQYLEVKIHDPQPLILSRLELTGTQDFQEQEAGTY